MNFTLLENGLDSLNAGKRFYSMYLENETEHFTRHTNLKLALTCIQNAIEILGKTVLSNMNEMLIYKDHNDTVLLEALRNTYVSDQSVESYLIQHNNTSRIKTIDYSECINRLKGLFNDEVTEGQYEYLKLLGDLRNQITHFGIKKDHELHQVLFAINQAFGFLVSFFTKKISRNDMDMFITFLGINELIREGGLREEDVWASYTANKFESLIKCTEKINDEEISLEYYIEDDERFIIIYLNEESVEEIRLVNNLMLDSTSFQVRDKVYAILYHLDENEPIYLLKETRDWDFFDYGKTKFWLNEGNGNPSRLIKRKYPLNEEGLREVIRSILKELDYLD